MPTSLKQFIIRRLKENVPLSEIRKDLQEKGYGIEIINKAVREAIAGVDKKISTVTVVQIGVLVVGVVIAVGVAVYLTSGKGSGEQATQYLQLCKNYPKIPNEISCDDAITSALERYSGEVYGIDKKNVEYGKELFRNLWIIGVNLESPIEVQPSKTEESKLVNKVEISVSYDGVTGIYRIV